MTATITISYGKILADIPYDNGRGPVQARQIPGHKGEWDETVIPKKFIGWSYPLTIETCYAFRRVFGRDLNVTIELAEWARNEIARADQLEELREGAIESVNLDGVAMNAPQLYLAMMSRKYQVAGAAFLVAGNGGLLGDEPGLGKTLQTIAALLEHGTRDILVSCPRTAKHVVWESEILRWAPTMQVFVADGTHAEREALFAEFQEYRDAWPETPAVLVINPEMLRGKKEYIERVVHHRDGSESVKRENILTPDFPWLFERYWDAIVMDESHDVLATRKNTMAKGISQWRLGAMNIRRRIKSGGLAIALSGTPFRSKLERSWGTLNWIRPDVFGSFWRFAETHFEVINDGWGNVIGTENEKGDRIAIPLDQAAFDRALRPYYLARTKIEVAPDLPPIAYAGTPPDDDPDGPCYVRLEMDPRQAKAYYQMVLDAEAQLEGGRITATGRLAEITRLRQLANAYGKIGPGRKILPTLPSNKIEWLTDFLRERENSSGKIVIASSFTEIVELVAEVIRKEGWEVLTLTGSASDKQRKNLIDRFQDPDDKLRVVVINSKAGGVAITLDQADEMVVIDMPWASDEFKQLRDRIHRVSRIHNVTIYRLLSIGTIEEWIAGLTDEQRRVLEEAAPKKLSELVLEALSR